MIEDKHVSGSTKIMDEDTPAVYHHVKKGCNVKQSTQFEDAIQEKQDHDEHYTNKKNMLDKLKNIMYSPHFCGLCIENNVPLTSIYACLKIHGIHGDNEDEKVSIKEILANIFYDISDVLVTSYICDSCIDKAVQSYTFIQNTKTWAKVISDYVTNFHSKISLLQDQIDPFEDHTSKYVIVIEPSARDVCGNSRNVTETMSEVYESVSQASERNDIIELEESTSLKSQNSDKPSKEVLRPILTVDGTKNKMKIKQDIQITNIISLTKNPLENGDKKAARPVKCKICFKMFSSRKALIVHYRRHDRSKCHICQMVVLNSHLQLHLKLHHQESVYSCDNCSMAYYTEIALEEHMDLHKHDSEEKCKRDHKCSFAKETIGNHLCRFKCTECVTFCLHHKYLTAYRESIFNRQTKKCPDCEYVCSGKHSLIEHANREHLNCHQHKCNVCGIEYYSKVSLEAHKLHLHSSDPVCAYCDQIFQGYKDLLNHNIDTCQSDYRKFKCNECKASFDTSEILAIHKDFRHKDLPCFKTDINSKIILIYNPKKSGDGNVMKVTHCPICKIPFGQNANYLEHIKKEHGSNYTCDECHENFGELTAFLIHYIQKHSESLVCELCGKSFKTQTYLTLHQRNSHAVPMKCHICSKLIRPLSMKCHLSWHKGQEKNVDQKLCKCDICCKTVTNKQFLKSHMNINRLKVKLFKCTVCVAVYSCQYLLNEHMKSHMWQRCSVCDKMIRTRSGLKKHMKLHRGKRPHVCNKCGEGFISVTYLKDHKKRHLGKNFNCPLCSRKFYFIRNVRYHIKHSHWDYKDRPFDHRLVKGLTKEHDYIFQDARYKNFGAENELVIKIE